MEVNKNINTKIMKTLKTLKKLIIKLIKFGIIITLSNNLNFNTTIDNNLRIEIINFYFYS